ncbi:MAG: carbohydrate ABC transporter permease [Eubacteriales bacterium]|nr:carbohydrate ABC transporter permease [Eubacteriales bacterium]
MNRTKRKNRIRSREDVILDIIIYVFCILIFIATVYPFWYVFIVSLNEGVDTALGGMYFWPRAFTLDNFKKFLTDITWLKALGVSVARTVIGTAIGVIFTMIVAYGLSFKDLLNRKLYMTMIIITMYFSGGIIPYYVLLRSLNLINTFYVYIIPGALNTFFLTVGLSFFMGIPSSLRESAKIDGASELKVFTHIILPISKPFVATLVLFIGVGHWNNWFDSTFYVRDKNLMTLSFRMMEVINKTKVSATAAAAGISSTTTSLSVQAAAMIIAVVPIILVYPFLQKYFVTGMFAGSVKE